MIRRGIWKKMSGKPPPLPLHPHHISHMKFSGLSKFSYTHNVVFATGRLKGKFCEGWKSSALILLLRDKNINMLRNSIELMQVMVKLTACACVPAKKIS